jgi:soluble lytic murein transglycosylase-like protein
MMWHAVRNPRIQGNMRPLRPILFAVVPAVSLASLALAPVEAAQTVLFDDGRVLEVASVTREADLAMLALEGGGSLAVAAGRISNWDDLARQSAEAPVRAAEEEARSYHDVRRIEPSDGGSLWRRAAGKWADLLAVTASRHDVDPALLTAVAHVESSFDPQAVSPKGAQGMLQLMPATAERFGVRDSFDVAENVDGGARYLRWLLDKFEGNAELAVAGYNAGENAVDRYQGIPPYAETRTYVARVMNQFNRFQQGTTVVP